MKDLDEKIGSEYKVYLHRIGKNLDHQLMFHSKYRASYLAT
jgi:hypothetical protein